MQDKRNIVLTGPGRSGTTLTCHLLNKLPNAIALAEPIAPGKFEHLLPDVEAVCDGIQNFYRKMRRMARTRGVVISKHVDGVVPDNPKAVVDGVRQRVVEKDEIPVGKELRPGFFLAIKDVAMFTSLLPTLAERMPCYAIVRNPLSVMASAHSLKQQPKKRKNPSAIARYSPEDVARIRSMPDPLSRTLARYDRTFELYAEHLPPETVIRYEDIVASGGKTLKVIVPSARFLEEPLELRNTNPLYDRDEMLRMGERLLASEGAYWRFYSKESVEDLLADL
jgi:hypothetical protein